MNELTYEFSLVKKEFRYEFLSVSPLKEVQKVVLMTQTQYSSIYNLALWDTLENGTLSDMSVTDNDDLKTVLATVIKIINSFLNENPNSFDIFKGSDARRHRLCRIIISRELVEIEKSFKVLAIKNNEIISFASENEMDFYLIGKHENKKKDYRISNIG